MKMKSLRAVPAPASEPTLTPAQYWKIRALSSQLALETEAAQRHLTTLREKLSAAIAEGGFDPQQNWAFNDEAETLVPAQTPPNAVG